MSFESNISEHIKTIEKKISDLEWDKRELIHDCDCDYCEYDGSIVDENQERADEIDIEIKELRSSIEAVKAHAKLHKIKVPA